MATKKIFPAMAFLIGTIAITSCEENPMTLKQGSTANASAPTKSGSQNGSRILNYTFDGTEGGAITLSTASAWVQNYANQNPQEVRSHFFGAASIQKILNTSGCIGIRIYYSLDDSGSKQLLLIGADGSGKDLLATGTKGKQSALTLTGINITDSFTTTDGASIAQTTTQQWIATYGGKYPNSLIAHFFGFEIINQILSQTNCIGIRMYYALNDAGVQQILLVGVSNKSQNILPSSLTGRADDAGDGTIGDMSYPCPTYCGGGS